jgi:hypothetical protein
MLEKDIRPPQTYGGQKLAYGRDPPDPTRSYTRPGSADALVKLLEDLDAIEAILFGWSLGGHYWDRDDFSFLRYKAPDDCRAPPVSRNNLAQGFNSSPQIEDGTTLIISMISADSRPLSSIARRPEEAASAVQSSSGHHLESMI